LAEKLEGFAGGFDKNNPRAAISCKVRAAFVRAAHFARTQNGDAACAWRRQKITGCGRATSRREASGWHESGNSRRMTAAILSFLLLSSLLCLLVSADRDAEGAAEAVRIRHDDL
jgi:hypothetical protein